MINSSNNNKGNGTGGVLSRGGTSVNTPSKRGGPPPSGFRCNRCAKPLTTTCFVCACDCVFCEGTYEFGMNELRGIWWKLAVRDLPLVDGWHASSTRTPRQ
jgi:hypothetical protein